MNVKEIIEKYLKGNDYDGLYTAEYECGCFLDDLMPCGETHDNCVAGHKVWGEFEGEKTWLIGANKNGGRVK